MKDDTNGHDILSAVKAAKDSGSDMLADAGAKMQDAAEGVRSATGRLASSRSPKSAATNLRSIVVSNPLGATIGALAAGFLVGMAFPVSDMERDKVGPLGDTLTNSAKATANEIVDHGKAAVADAVSEALGQTISKPKA